MAIDMVRCPPEVSVGFVAALNFGTSVIRMDGASSERQGTLECPLIMWSATKGVWSKARVEEFMGFARARHGSLHAFRFWDPTDFSTSINGTTESPTVLDQFLGYGDGTKTEFDLFRKYTSVPGDLAQRLAVEDRMLPIHDEVDDRLAAKIGLPAGHNFEALFAVNGTPTTAFTIDWVNRRVSFSVAPALDAVVTGGWYYDWPAILDQDTDNNLERIAESWTAQSAPAIGLESVPFERMLPETDDPGGYKELSWSLGSPLIQKAIAKVWSLVPAGPGRTVRLQSPEFMGGGGPHFILDLASGLDSVDVLDELTGSVIFTLAASQTAFMMVEADGATRTWRYVVA